MIIYKTRDLASRTSLSHDSKIWPGDLAPHSFSVLKKVRTLPIVMRLGEWVNEGSLFYSFLVSRLCWSLILLFKSFKIGPSFELWQLTWKQSLCFPEYPQPSTLSGCSCGTLPGIFCFSVIINLSLSKRFLASIKFEKDKT